MRCSTAGTGRLPPVRHTSRAQKAWRPASVLAVSSTAGYSTVASRTVAIPCTPPRSAAAALRTRPRARAMELEPATPKTQKSTSASLRLCFQGGRGWAVHRQRIEPRWSWPVLPQCAWYARTGTRAVRGPPERAAERASGTSERRRLVRAPRTHGAAAAWHDCGTAWLWLQAARVTGVCSVRAHRVVARG
eukprot:scaffold61542_cov63-Phaeocystis_antarctica.AAC.7